MSGDMDSMFVPRCVSYLQARDPSILSWNRHGMANVRHNLAEEFTESSIAVECDKKDEGLSVHLRIKGGVPYHHLYSVEGNTLICHMPIKQIKNRRHNVVLKKYKFTRVFGPHSSQKELFDSIIKPKLLNFLNGNNSSLFTYGTSGSGKTFTMVGTMDEPGIIPRSLEYIFRTLKNPPAYKASLKPRDRGDVVCLNDAEKERELEILKRILSDSGERHRHVKTTYLEMRRRLSNDPVAEIMNTPRHIAVWVSFVEIYNEDIYDLLEPIPGRNQHRQRLKLGGVSNDIYIRNLKYVYVRNGTEAYQVLQYGLHNLSYAATAVNHHSSRAHCIFSIRLVAGNDRDNCNVSVFNFVDLAGSERLKKTGNEGDRLKESVKINSSLSVLGRCISSIRDMQSSKDSCTSAPFRESKLTQLFQKALMRMEDIGMIVNINPSEEMFDDTQHALIFSAIAKEIISKETDPIKPSRFSNFRKDSDAFDEREEEMRNLREINADLLMEISLLKQQLVEEVEGERNHLRKNYEEILEVKDRQLADFKKDIKKKEEKYEKHIKFLNDQLREAKQVQTIVLSDSDDDITSTLKIQEMEEALESMKEAHEKQLADRVAELEQSHQNSIEKLQRDFEMRQTSVENDLKDLRYDYDDLFKRAQELENEISELNKEKYSLSDELSQKNLEVEELRLQVDSLKREATLALDECKEDFSDNSNSVLLQKIIPDEICNWIEKKPEF